MARASAECKNGELPGAALKWVALLYGDSDDGHALHAYRKTAHERPMPLAPVRAYLEAESPFPTAKRRHETKANL
jgi:hypothetical protein